MFGTFVRLHGKTHDYKVLYTNIARLYMLTRSPEDPSISVVVRSKSTSAFVFASLLWQIPARGGLPVSNRRRRYLWTSPSGRVRPATRTSSSLSRAPPTRSPSPST